MYIKSAEITNIRSIENFKIEFENPAGWHVLIGDNGSGKSTIIRSIALALVGPNEARGLWADWRDWLRNNESEGKIELQIEPSADTSIDEYVTDGNNVIVPNILTFKRKLQSIKLDSNMEMFKEGIRPVRYNWGEYNKGWFSAAYGPYRRFSGGDARNKDVFDNRQKLGAHLSAFGEDVALTETTEWLMNLNYKTLEKKEQIKVEDLIKQFSALSESSQEELLKEMKKSLKKKGSDNIISDLKKLINSENFLPNNTKLEKISSEGVFFKDGNDSLITVNQLSDGYRSILSLTFELIRQLVRVYSEKAVFKNIREDKMYIDLPGVVLIDEIDAHLHPTWQTKIGQWFLKYFPNIQFIVTRHSPLVCRAAINGTIWKLAEPGSDEKSKEITGIDRDRLIYGNLIEAYGTGAFEKDVSPSENSEKMRKELADLSKKSFKGIITETEKKEMNRIKEILPAS